MKGDTCRNQEIPAFYKPTDLTSSVNDIEDSIDPGYTLNSGNV